VNRQTEFAPYRRLFRKKFRYGNSVLNCREGFLLRRKINDGSTIVAEASPLPSHSRESLADVLEALRKSPADNTVPSLAFALESLELLEAGKSSSFNPAAANALIPFENLESASARIAQLRADGFSCFKIKISPANLQEVAKLIGGASGLRFRLDANGSLDPALLEILFRFLRESGASERVDYIEEPYPRFWENSRLRNSPVSLAADESANSSSAIDTLLRAPAPPQAVIIKPTVFGSLVTLDQLVHRLEGAGVSVVFGSSLECEPGRRALISFLGRRANAPAGLNTGFLFSENYLPDLPLWKETPAVGAEEEKWLEGLSWSKLPW
jgi:o-succinylbenzoate synthase